MGLKKIFKKKEPSEKELVDDLQRLGISTRSSNGRHEKFSAFKQYAHERQSQRTGLAPVNPYADMNGGQQNPYTASSIDTRTGIDKERELGGDSYANSERSGGGHPQSAAGFDPYSSNLGHRDITGGSTLKNTGYDRKGENSHSVSVKEKSQRILNEKGNHHQPNPRLMKHPKSDQNRPSQKNYISSTGHDDESTLDLNDIPSSRPPVQLKRSNRQAQNSYDASVDLNELPGEDLNVDLDEICQEEEQVNSEDEEVETIKQDIRFTKQESVASTRNTLRMAQEAEASGTNTLGMLGSQSERLYNAEQNLLLADTQTKIADEKVRELGRLNRSIFIPATGNPFNKKSRLRQQESKLKSEKIQEKYLRDTNRKGMYASEQRLTQGITNKSASSELFNKYQGEKQIQQAQRYQFENDSEDDEMEKELASNLDQISNYSKKLKSTAKIMGQEVDAQNERLRRIEEDADRLDINVHLNSSRLNNIR